MGIQIYQPTFKHLLLRVVI